MAFLTDRKRAEGLGSAKEGASHHWQMILSSAALLVLMPLFVFILGPLLGAPHAEVVAALSRPFNAIVLGLGVVVGMVHFRHGVQVLIEDYIHGAARPLLIVVMTWVSYGLIAAGLFALARIAL